MTDRRNAVITFLIDDDRILLAESNYRQNKITWNGISGYTEMRESPEMAAIRELYEEIKIHVNETDLEKVGIIHYYDLQEKDVRQETLTITVFLCRRFSGEPRSTPGVYPRWFTFDDIPYSDMFDDTEPWLKKILSGDEVIVEILSRIDTQTGISEVENVLVRSPLLLNLFSRFNIVILL
ncbi:MAG: NUDIX domain-containing protein [Patescibacteria group bacterium]